MDMRGAANAMADANRLAPERGDFVKNGVLYCGKCGTAKQYFLTCNGQRRPVGMMCKCKAQAAAAEEKARTDKAMADRIQRLKDASMMPGSLREAVFEKCDINAHNQNALRIAGIYADQFEKMEKQNQGLIFYGPTGTGKSHTAACIANRLLGKGVPVIMTSFVEILRDVRNADLIQSLNGARLLIIDDLGAERGTDYAIERIYDVVDTRVRLKKPMILTTNLQTNEMLSETELRYRRIYDRILEVCYSVKIDGGSRRIENGMRRQNEMSKFFESAI